MQVEKSLREILFSSRRYEEKITFWQQQEQTVVSLLSQPLLQSDWQHYHQNKFGTRIPSWECIEIMSNALISGIAAKTAHFYLDFYDELYTDARTRAHHTNSEHPYIIYTSADSVKDLRQEFTRNRTAPIHRYPSGQQFVSNWWLYDAVSTCYLDLLNFEPLHVFKSLHKYRGGFFQLLGPIRADCDEIAGGRFIMFFDAPTTAHSR